MKQCGECGSYDLEYWESGTDDIGDYDEYVCTECSEITRFSI